MWSAKEGQEILKLNGKYQFVDLVDDHLLGDTKTL
jgi:hypothetical protein